MIIAVIMFLYYNSLDCFFFAEDLEFIQYVSEYYSLYQAFILEFFSVNDKHFVFYRPLTSETMFWVCYKLFGLNTLGYRSVILLFFILENFLVYVIFLRLTQKKIFALVASICYATRGAHFVIIYWISAGFQNTFVTFFLLCSILLYLLNLQNRNKFYYLGSILFAILALTSKESGIVIPLIIILLEMYLQDFTINRNIKNILRRSFPFCLIVVAYILRMFLIGNMQILSKTPYKLQSSLNNFFYNLKFYGKNLFDNPVEAILLSGLCILAVLSLRNRKTAMFAMGWFIIGLLPFIFIGGVKSPYYLHFSLIGFSFLVALGAQYIHEKYFFTRIALPPLLVFLLVSSAYSNIKIQEASDYHALYPPKAFLLISSVTTKFPILPDGSLIFIQNKQALPIKPGMTYDLKNDKLIFPAIKLFYMNNVSIYFEGITEKIPLEYSQAYYFNYNGSTLEFSGNTL